MATASDVGAVLTAIAPLEGPELTGCAKADIVEATKLDETVVASALAYLWETHQIEAVGHGLGGTIWPNLTGILRVLTGRPREWGSDGYYKPRPLYEIEARLTEDK